MSVVAAVHRYYNSHSQDHFYTTNEVEIGTTTKNQSGKETTNMKVLALLSSPIPM